MTVIALAAVLLLTVHACRKLRAAAADIDRVTAEHRHLRIVP